MHRRPAVVPNVKWIVTLDIELLTLTVQVLPVTNRLVMHLDYGMV